MASCKTCSKILTFGLRTKRYCSNQCKNGVPSDKAKKVLSKIFNISSEKYDAFLLKQDNKCAICNKIALQKALHVDHDHRCCSGKQSCGNCIRGLLCNKCNVLLGYAQDDPEILLNARNYLVSNPYVSICKNE